MVRRRGLQYEIEVTGKFVGPLDDFVERVNRAKQAWTDFQAVRAANQADVTKNTRQQARDVGAAAAAWERQAKAAKSAAQSTKQAATSSSTYANRTTQGANATGKLAKNARATRAAIFDSGRAAGGLLTRLQRAAVVFGRILTIFALFRGGQALFGALTGAARLAIEFSSNIEQAQLSIQALVSTVFELRDAQGDLLEGSEKFAAAQSIAADQTRKLRIEGLKTVATFDQLLETFQVAVAPGAQAGLAIDQIRQLTVAISQAAQGIGLPQNQLPEEIRSLLSGTITARNTRIATALGITNEDIARWKEAGTLFQNLSQEFEQFARAGVVGLETFQGRLSNLRDALGQTLATGLSDSFEEVKDLLLTIQNSLVEVGDDSIGLASSGIGQLLNVVDDFASRGLQSLQRFFSELDFSELIADVEAFLEIIEATITVFSGLIDVLRPTFSVFRNIFGTIAAIINLVRDVVQGIEDWGIAGQALVGIIKAVSGTALAILLTTKAWTAAATRFSSSLATISLQLAGMQAQARGVASALAGGAAASATGARGGLLVALGGSAFGRTLGRVVGTLGKAVAVAGRFAGALGLAVTAASLLDGILGGRISDWVKGLFGVNTQAEEISETLGDGEIGESLVLAKTTSEAWGKAMEEVAEAIAKANREAAESRFIASFDGANADLAKAAQEAFEFFRLGVEEQEDFIKNQESIIGQREDLIRKIQEADAELNADEYVQDLRRQIRKIRNETIGQVPQVQISPFNTIPDQAKLREAERSFSNLTRELRELEELQTEQARRRAGIGGEDLGASQGQLEVEIRQRLAQIEEARIRLAEARAKQQELEDAKLLALAEKQLQAATERRQQLEGQLQLTSQIRQAQEDQFERELSSRLDPLSAEIELIRERTLIAKEDFAARTSANLAAVLQGRNLEVITRRQVAALVDLGNAGREASKEIAEEYNKTLATTVGLIDRLEESIDRQSEQLDISSAGAGLEGSARAVAELFERQSIALRRSRESILDLAGGLRLALPVLESLNLADGASQFLDNLDARLERIVRRFDEGTALLIEKNINEDLEKAQLSFEELLRDIRSESDTLRESFGVQGVALDFVEARAEASSFFSEQKRGLQDTLAQLETIEARFGTRGSEQARKIVAGLIESVRSSLASAEIAQLQLGQELIAQGSRERAADLRQQNIELGNQLALENRLLQIRNQGLASGASEQTISAQQRLATAKAQAEIEQKLLNANIASLDAEAAKLPVGKEQEALYAEIAALVEKRALLSERAALNEKQLTDELRRQTDPVFSANEDIRNDRARARFDAIKGAILEIDKFVTTTLSGVIVSALFDGEDTLKEQAEALARSLAQIFIEEFLKRKVFTEGFFEAIFGASAWTGGLMGKWKGGQMQKPKGYHSGGGAQAGLHPSDVIPAYLAAGEHVMPRKSVNYYGVEFLEMLRKRKLNPAILQLAVAASGIRSGAVSASRSAVITGTTRRTGRPLGFNEGGPVPAGTGSGSGVTVVNVFSEEELVAALGQQRPGRVIVNQIKAQRDIGRI